MPNFLINTDKKLSNIFKDLENSKNIGLDTEFIRESSYFPQLALLQLSDEKNNYCIDIFEIENNSLIIELLTNINIRKILHSSKQDLEVLHHYFGCYPKNIFDTQIASNLTDCNISISYSNLVKQNFNVELKEGSWRTDWLKRPISEEKIEYAANDVKYLIPLSKIFLKKLKELDRLEWFYEEQDTELSKSNIVTDPKKAWKKITIPINLSNNQLLRLQLISEWREIKAIKKNMPRRWIISDRELIKISTSTLKELPIILDNSKQTLSIESKEKILSIINNKNETSKEDKSLKLDLNAYNKKISKCNETIAKVCEKYNVASTLIANKRDIDYFARGCTDIRFLKGWRFKIFGKLVQ